MEDSVSGTKIDLSRLFGFAQVERVSGMTSESAELHSKVGGSEVGGSEIVDRESPRSDSSVDQALELHSKVGQTET